jgi:hypothetical protein
MQGLFRLIQRSVMGSPPGLVSPIRIDPPYIGSPGVEPVLIPGTFRAKHGGREPGRALRHRLHRIHAFDRISKMRLAFFNVISRHSFLGHSYLFSLFDLFCTVANISKSLLKFRD